MYTVTQHQHRRPDTHEPRRQGVATDIHSNETEHQIILDGPGSAGQDTDTHKYTNTHTDTRTKKYMCKASRLPPSPPD